MATITAIEMREAIRKNPELRALFAQAVTIELLEQQIVERQGTFRASPPGIENFTDEIYETVITELAQEAKAGTVTDNPEATLHKVDIAERTIAAAFVLGWMADKYSRNGEEQSFDEFASDFLLRYS